MKPIFTYSSGVMAVAALLSLTPAATAQSAE